MAPADVRGGLAARARGALGAAPDALVGVDPLVGDGRDLGGVPEQAGDEGAADLGELVLGARLVERVAVALEEGEVGVHARAGVLGERLRHEGGLDALLQRDLLHDQAEGHDVVGGGERVGVAQVDLLLAGGALVVAELHRDAHRFEHGDRLAAEVHADVLRGVVEVAGVVGGRRAGAVQRLVLQQEELDLGVGVEGEAEVGGLGEDALEHVARVGEGRGAVGHQDVAEHPGRAGGLGAPGQDLEGARIRLGDHVGLVDPGEALDGGAVEADALVEGLLQLGGCHRDGLEEAEHVGEPQAHEPDVALLERTEHEFLLLVHGPLSLQVRRLFQRARGTSRAPVSRGRVSARFRTRPDPLLALRHDVCIVLSCGPLPDPCVRRLKAASGSAMPSFVPLKGKMSHCHDHRRNETGARGDGGARTPPAAGAAHRAARPPRPAPTGSGDAADAPAAHAHISHQHWGAHSSRTLSSRRARRGNRRRGRRSARRL